MVKYYLGFFQNKNKLNPAAWSIRIAEQRDTSHVEVIRVIDNDWETALSYGSIFPKSRVIHLQKLQEHYLLKRTIELSVQVPQIQADEILKSLMGHYYSFGQIFLTSLRILFGGVTVCLNGVKPNLSKYLICTELAGLFMQEACQYRFEQSPEILTLDECEAIGFAYSPKD